ncbi:hypothetical protein K458DRAFT_486857 [Lentithecium fluviatile CBS 122367]|uniref:Cora-domain-containing protein n=1 Tax=Lentithecium fluviatile CBS 122367 TaxID=1168545 RepID=A0A6G1J536_9PLEO|nr:hypothetical protein K458DRAFT_486857 [Lentithecium fluviatile CBS 122367]
MHGIADETRYSSSDVIEPRVARILPFLITSLVIQFNLERRSQILGQIRDDIYRLECVLGTRFSRPVAVDVTTLDFELLNRGINAITRQLAHSSWLFKSTTRQLGFLDDVARRYRGLAAMNVVAHLQCWNENLEKAEFFFPKKTQAFVQMVYSGITQRDSVLSQNAAIASAQDSAVMRVIAAITIIFLPATTTAIFSTSFFDFNVSRHERVYSWWLWLYWLVTIILTAIVLPGAIFWWRKEEAKTNRRVGKTKVTDIRGRHAGEKDV